MTSPNLPPNLRTPRTRPHAGHRLRGWNPRLSQPPASALEARLTRAFHMLGAPSAPLVSMLHSRSTGLAGRRRR